jgi:hypothetical protein|tara:strand:- start:759 stop:929 length:171 start_codon:yes stop_codon:yes gene_type:complete
MGLFILAVIMFITNLLGVYFTFKTWYGKQSNDIPVLLDEFGNIEIDEEQMKKDADN